MTMLTYIISTIVIFCACTIGAIVGFGGGVIIKPVLDSMNFCTIDIVNFVSSCAVLAMSISSIVRHKIQKTKFDKKIALSLSLGAVVGGYLGNRLFGLAIAGIGKERLVVIQAVMIIAFVGFAEIYVNMKNPKTFHLTNPVAMAVSGVALGMLNSFLGIGGGPINMTVLLLLFSLAVKQGAVYSICVVFFCQLSNLVTLFIHNRFEPYADYLPLIICGMIAAVVGGLVGSTFNKKFSDKTVRIVFSLVMLGVFGINVYNIIVGVM